MFRLIYENMLRFLSLTAGCFYPAFVSFKLLNARRVRLNDKEITDNLCVWLTYWIVYGVWSMVDFATMGLMACFPLLSEMKLVFICWLLPTLGAGSQVIYDEFLYSFFSNNERTIEQALVHAALGFADFLDRLLRFCLSRIMGVVDDYLLTRGLRQGPAAIPMPPTSIDDNLVKLEFERKQKEEKTEDLESTIEKALGEDTGKDDNNLSLNISGVLDDTESDNELVFSECNKKPEILPNNFGVRETTEFDELVFKECNNDPKISANNFDVVDKTFSEEEVFSECKVKPLILPKPIKARASIYRHVSMELKTVLNLNQYADKTEKSQ